MTEIITARIERLHEGARALLGAICVLGDDPDEEALAALLSPTEDRAAAEAQLARAAFVRDRRMVHPLFLRLAIAMMSKGRRAQLHAKALEAREGAAVEVRAHHAACAGDAFHALLLLEEVAKVRGACGDLDGAAFALRTAVEIARAEIDRGELEDPLRALLVFSRKLADVLAEDQAYEGACGVLREALDVASPGDADRAEMLARLAQFAHARTQKVEAQGYLREALRLARKSDARELVRSLETLERAIA